MTGQAFDNQGGRLGRGGGCGSLGIHYRTCSKYDIWQGFLYTLQKITLNASHPNGNRHCMSATICVNGFVRSQICSYRYYDKFIANYRALTKQKNWKEPLLGMLQYPIVSAKHLSSFLLDFDFLVETPRTACNGAHWPTTGNCWTAVTNHEALSRLSCVDTLNCIAVSFTEFDTEIWKL